MIDGVYEGRGCSCSLLTMSLCLLFPNRRRSARVGAPCWRGWFRQAGQTSGEAGVGHTSARERTRAHTSAHECTRSASAHMRAQAASAAAEKTLLLCSGGVESAVLVAQILAAQRSPVPLFADYAQRGAERERQALAVQDWSWQERISPLWGHAVSSHTPGPHRRWIS